MRPSDADSTEATADDDDGDSQDERPHAQTLLIDKVHSPAPGVSKVGGRLLRRVRVDGGAARGVRAVGRRGGPGIPKRDDERPCTKRSMTLSTRRVINICIKWVGNQCGGSHGVVVDGLSGSRANFVSLEAITAGVDVGDGGELVSERWRASKERARRRQISEDTSPDVSVNVDAQIKSYPYSGRASCPFAFLLGIRKQMTESATKALEGEKARNLGWNSAITLTIANSLND